MARVFCVFCNTTLPAEPLAGGIGDLQCLTCHRVTEVVLFPALLDSGALKPPPLASDPPAEGEAACFYSPNRRATKSCNHCGVLISDSWAAQWGSETICLKCLEHLRDKKDQRFESSRTLWDNVALLLACLPLTIFLWVFAFVTAPASVFVALWHWNSPRSMVPRSRFRLVLALILGLCQIGAGVAFFLQVWFKASSGNHGPFPLPR